MLRASSDVHEQPRHLQYHAAGAPAAGVAPLSRISALGLQVQSGDEQAVEARLFAAVCWGPGDPATTMVMLNRDGQLVDVLYAGQLSGAIRRTRRSAQGVEDIFLDPAKARHSGLPACPRHMCVQHSGLPATHAVQCF